MYRSSRYLPQGLCALVEFVFQLRPSRPPMCNVATHRRAPACMHVHLEILHFDPALAAGNAALGPAGQFHCAVVFLRAGQQPHGMHGIHPSVAAIDHAQALRVQSLQDRRCLDQSKAYVFRGDDLQPAPKMFLGLSAALEELISGEDRLLNQPRRIDFCSTERSSSKA